MRHLQQTIERHVIDLRRYARALTGGSADADELVQECLARALARQHFWTRIRDLRAYLFTILHNVHVDRLAGRRREGHTVDLDDALPELSRPAPQLATIELRDLARALKVLPPEQREVVLLVGLEGLSYQRTADILDIPLGTVMSRLSRGRAALHHMMEQGAEAGIAFGTASVTDPATNANSGTLRRH